VGKVTMPTNVVHPIVPVTVNDVDNVLNTVVDAIPDGALSALTWIPSKISEMKTVIASLFESVMQPVYAALVTIMTAVTSVWAAIGEFWNKYLRLTAIRERISLLLSMGRKLVVEDLIQGIVVGELLPGFVTVLQTIKGPIIDFIGNASERLWDFLGTVGNGVSKLFGEVYKVVVKTTSLVAKNVLSVAYYAFGTGLDRLTWFVPVRVSVKIIAVVMIISYMFIGGFIERTKNVAVFAERGLTELARTAYFVASNIDYRLDLVAAKHWSTFRYLLGPATLLGFNANKVIADAASKAAASNAAASKVSSLAFRMLV
jgi:hypothetical protein